MAEWVKPRIHAVRMGTAQRWVVSFNDRDTKLPFHNWGNAVAMTLAFVWQDLTGTDLPYYLRSDTLPGETQ